MVEKDYIEVFTPEMTARLIAETTFDEPEAGAFLPPDAEAFPAAVLKRYAGAEEMPPHKILEHLAQKLNRDYYEPPFNENIQKRRHHWSGGHNAEVTPWDLRFREEKTQEPAKRMRKKGTATKPVYHHPSPEEQIELAVKRMKIKGITTTGAVDYTQEKYTWHLPQNGNKRSK